VLCCLFKLWCFCFIFYIYSKELPKTKYEFLFSRGAYLSFSWFLVVIYFCLDCDFKLLLSNFLFFTTWNRQHSTSETLYHSLNRQHNTSETLYHSLNRQHNTSETLYHSLNRQHNTSETLYHSLNSLVVIYFCLDCDFKLLLSNFLFFTTCKFNHRCEICYSLLNKIARSTIYYSL
jgi:hypothetical protein